MDPILFTSTQLVSLLGVAQSLYALVYMWFRAGRLSRAGLAIVYFMVLLLGFFYDFTFPVFEKIGWSYATGFSWLIWFLLPSLSYLLILQIAHIQTTPKKQAYLVLLLPVIAFSLGHYLDEIAFIFILGMLSGGLSLLMVFLFGKRRLLQNVRSDRKSGQARYWLIICLVLVNVVFLLCTLLLVTNLMSVSDWVLSRNILGLGFVYLASTSLFRIYPQAVIIKERRSRDPKNMKNRVLVDALIILLEEDRVYQEPQYGRKDLARELDVSETVVSQLVNQQYQETVPQLLNRYRVEEAKLLLKQTNAEAQVIAQEVGFNSLTTFNRVFKELVGKTPSAYR